MRTYGKVRRGIRTVKKASGRIGSILVIVGAALIIAGHVIGESGVLSITLAACGDASAIIGFGMVLRQLVH